MAQSTAVPPPGNPPKSRVPIRVRGPPCQCDLFQSSIVCWAGKQFVEVVSEFVADLAKDDASLFHLVSLTLRLTSRGSAVPSRTHEQLSL
mmetsp:Transcript_35215/g.100591  ORF Transcript_35215/g.100591 Transcript_35215/m.100591 type:complete len:90 (+) Transcript_35215:2099-2368(+)